MENAGLEVKARLVRLGRKQVQLLKPLKTRGIKADPSRLSDALNGYRESKYAMDIIAACDEIITEWERQEYSA